IGPNPSASHESIWIRHEGVCCTLTLAKEDKMKEYRTAAECLDNAGLVSMVW
ncbi:unnamed protein product, partial [Musa acuminata subsp. burmannicoides]